MNVLKISIYLKELTMSKFAKLDLGDQSLELPVIEGSEGEKALDISKLRAQTGYITLDEGYVNTGSCQSGVTFLNGEKGILKYRGYPIEQLADHSNFLEVSYLLLHGNLPSESEYETFKAKMNHYHELPKGVEQLIQSFPKDAHPMGILSSALSALSGYYPQFLGPDYSYEDKEQVFAQLLSYMKLISACHYRHVTGKSFHGPDAKLNYSEDFTYLMFHDHPSEVDKDVAEALNALLILHADHEQNCSASTVRMVGSAKANLYASIAAGVNALWGPSHGGANQAVIEMLDMIQADGGDYKKYLEKAKDKNDPFRLMGFGHRVYKNFDPRAKIIKRACDSVLSKLGVDDPVLDVAKGLEAVALEDDYFVSRKLYPNVDFYSGIIYRALGIPTNMFTVMFAIGRLPGWMSQWNEMVSGGPMKICRPRQIYTGENTREYIPMNKRK
jgi:citrate synthase